MNLQRILLAIAISSGLTLATVSHAQYRHWWRTPAPADSIAPTTPTGLAASAITPTSVMLSWGAASDNVGVTGYRVYVNGTLLVSPGSTSVQVTELLAGGTRSFTVAAFDAAGNVSAPSAPLSVTTPLTTPPPAPTPPPVSLPQIQWSAGMATGDLSQWTEKVNTGYADSAAVTAASAGIPPHGGGWVLKQSVIRPSGVVEASGTRMARYPEIDALAKAGTTFYYSWWDFFPTALSYNASGWYNHWQIASNDASNTGTPVWALSISGSGNTMVLAWGPNGSVPIQGPHAGESGDRTYTAPIAVPVGQWVFFEF